MSEVLGLPDTEWLEERQELMAKAMAASREGFDLHHQQTVRSEICGRASYFLLQQLVEAGYDAELMWSVPEDLPAVAGSQRHTTAHIIVNASTEADDVHIDGSYSQFFKQFGLRAGLIDTMQTPNDDTKINRNELSEQLNAFMPGYNPFPKERVLVYTEDMVPDIAAWGASVVKLFWQNHAFSQRFQHAHHYTSDWVNRTAFEQIFKPVVGISQQELEDFFMAVWDPNRYRRYRFDAAEETDMVNWYEDTVMTIDYYESTGKWVSPQELRLKRE